jgi:hypothetical protein
VHHKAWRQPRNTTGSPIRLQPRGRAR